MAILAAAAEEADLLKDARQRINRRLAMHRIELLRGKKRGAVARDLSRFSRGINLRITQPDGQTFRYTEHNYHAIAHIINRGLLAVFKFQETRGSSNGSYSLSGESGQHLHENRELKTIPKHILVQSTLVHEATHVAQDFMDSKGSLLDIETHAHIAQGIVFVRNGVGRELKGEGYWKSVVAAYHHLQTGQPIPAARYLAARSALDKAYSEDKSVDMATSDRQDAQLPERAFRSLFQRSSPDGRLLPLAVPCGGSIRVCTAESCFGAACERY